MARSLQEQILAAFEESDLTLDELIRLAKLDMDTSSLSRKLRGKQDLWATECEAIAHALRTVISTGRKAA